MNNLHDDDIEYNKKQYLEDFLFHIYLSLRKRENLEFYFKKCIMESSTKSVQADLNCKTKKASKYFFIILNIIIVKVVHFEYELCHQNKSASVYSGIFCRAFHAASF